MTKRDGTLFVEPHQDLYTNELCMAVAGAPKVAANKPFRPFVANSGEKAVYLAPNQQLATAESHPENLLESNFSHAELFGLIDEANRKFQKQNDNVHGIETINEPLADQRGQHMGDSEEPARADDIDLDIPDNG